MVGAQMLWFGHCHVCILDDQEIIQFLAEQDIFFLSPKYPGWPAAHSASYLVGTWSHFLVGKVVRALSGPLYCIWCQG